MHAYVIIVVGHRHRYVPPAVNLFMSYLLWDMVVKYQCWLSMCVCVSVFGGGGGWGDVLILLDVWIILQWIFSWVLSILYLYRNGNKPIFQCLFLYLTINLRISVCVSPVGNFRRNNREIPESKSFHIISHVLCDSICHCVGRSVGRSVRRSVQGSRFFTF